MPHPPESSFSSEQPETHVPHTMAATRWNTTAERSLRMTDPLSGLTYVAPVPTPVVPAKQEPPGCYLQNDSYCMTNYQGMVGHGN